MMAMVAAIVVQVTFASTDFRPVLVLRQVNAIKVETGWAQQADTCVITLPRNTVTFDRFKVTDLFRRGDRVSVEMGVNGVLKKEFEGYITDVSADVPVVITCVDEMWKLRQLPANVSLRKGSRLPELVREVVGDRYATDVIELELPAELLRFSNTTVAAVLAKVKEVTGLPSYFQNGRLVVGKVYADNDGTVHEVNLDKLPPGNSLSYRRADDRKVRVVAVSTNDNGREKLEVEVGDTDGEQKQVTFVNVTDNDTLRKLAQRELDRLKVDGYEGSIEGIVGLDAVHGDKVKLRSTAYPDRDGIYYVDRRGVSMDDSPKFRVTLEIGPKAIA